MSDNKKPKMSFRKAKPLTPELAKKQKMFDAKVQAFCKSAAELNIPMIASFRIGDFISYQSNCDPVNAQLLAGTASNGFIKRVEKQQKKKAKKEVQKNEC